MIPKGFMRPVKFVLGIIMFILAYLLYAKNTPMILQYKIIFIIALAVSGYFMVKEKRLI